MNYYRFHLGDYIAATAHLDPLEDIAYRRLLDMYYLTETPIPNETQTVSKKIRMFSHVDVVEAVLREFFTLDNDNNCWVHTRCSDEISAYQAKCEKNQEVGKKGGRPKTETDNLETPEKTQTVLNENPNVTLTNNHKPITNNHKKDNAQQAELFARFWSEYPRKESKADALKAWNKIHPSDQLFSEIMFGLDGAKRSQQWLKDNGQYIPHPSTWLNKRRWQDIVDHNGITHSADQTPEQVVSNQGEINRRRMICGITLRDYEEARDRGDDVMAGFLKSDYEKARASLRELCQD